MILQQIPHWQRITVGLARVKLQHSTD